MVRKNSIPPNSGGIGVSTLGAPSEVFQRGQLAAPTVDVSPSLAEKIILCLPKTSYILASLNLSLLIDKLTSMLPVLISVLAVLRGVVRSRVALHLEVLALRHQLQVLQRSRPRRVRLAKADRWLWAWLSRS